MEIFMDFNDFEEIICPECENDALAFCFKLLRLSALKSSDGKESRRAIPTYSCAACYTEVPIMPIYLGEYEVEVCSCGKDLFSPYHKLLKLSALKSNTGKEEFKTIALYSCVSCGTIFNIKEEESITLP